MTTAGALVCRLPDRSIPLAWLPQDESLIVVRTAGGTDTSTGNAALRLERWRVPHPSVPGGQPSP